MKSIEYIVACLIVITLSYVFYPKTPIREIEPETNNYFDEYPIEYWESTDDGGDIVWVRFRVLQDNTKLWVRDMAGNIVHKTPFSVNPYSEESNKPTKIYSYVWKLYKSQRSREILPGDYEIIVGTKINSSNNYYLDIEI